MKTIQRTIAIAIAVSLLLVPALQTKVFADEPGNVKPEFKQYSLPEEGQIANWGINDVGIHAVFEFSAGQEIIDSFRMFDTGNTGFDRARGITNFALQGVISNDKPLLYEAVDKAFYLGANSQHDFKTFDADVLFTHGNQAYRIFSYDNCKIKNYNILTPYDKDETFIGKQKWAYLDKFDFECRGVTISNPTYDQMKQDQTQEYTADVLAKMKQQVPEKNAAKNNEIAKAQMLLQKHVTQKTVR